VAQSAATVGVVDTGVAATGFTRGATGVDVGRATAGVAATARGVTIVRVPAHVDRLFDLGILDLELEGAGQGRRQIERHPGDQQ